MILRWTGHTEFRGRLKFYVAPGAVAFHAGLGRNGAPGSVKVPDSAIRSIGVGRGGADDHTAPFSACVGR